MIHALEIQHLTKSYDSGVKALTDINLTIEDGELFAILGPNGAGKSTLINIAAQVVRKSGGRVSIFGCDIDRQPQQAKMLLGYTPQDIALDMFFSVREILRNHSGYYGLRHNDAWINELLERLGLAEHADKNSRELSGGMKRRLTVAKALAHKPKLLILDEPTAGVDVELRHALWVFVRELHATGTTVILTTHYIEEAQDLAGRVAIMNHGRVVACEETEKLLADFGSRQVRVKLTEAAGGAMVDLPEGLRMGEQGGEVIGELSTKGSRPFFEWMARHSERIEDLQIEEARLEDVFLQLTRAS
ncbi:MAG: ABC transporter ATP-binding protein [Magnetococcales bacterium]|nr:ABC transporter ATP-binding protein [Magnetococcales bacterium]